MYDQIRLIDLNGNERLRINSEGGKFIPVNNALLQNKADRYYFRESTSKKFREIYISPMDLNQENGEFEYPYKSVIRIALPLFDSSEEKRGILVLNVLGKYLLDTLQMRSEDAASEANLISSDGYWLFSPDSEKQWGFLLPERRFHRFSSEFEDAWNRIIESEKGQAITEKGLFTFTTVRPYSYFYSDSRSSEQSGNPENELMWKLVLHIPENILSERAWSTYFQFFKFYVALLVILAGLSVILAVNMVNRKASETALKESEHQFRSVAQSANDAILSIDSDGHIIFWNPVAEKVFGYSSEEITGRQLETIIPENVRQQFRTAFDHSAKKDSSISLDRSVEYRGLRKDGTSFPLELSISSWHKDNKRYFTGIIRDISERKKRESEISESNALLQSVIHSPENIDIVSLDPDYKYLLFNDVHRKVMKSVWNADVEKGLSILDLISDDEDRTELKNSFDRALSGDTFLETHKINGSESRYFESLYSPIVRENDNIIGITVFSTDVTERVFAENTRLQQEKLNGALEMAGAACHEFNQPLQVILGYASLMAAKLPEGDPLRKKLEIIVQQSERMGELTNNLQNITKYKTMEYLDKKIIDINGSSGGNKDNE